MKPIPYYLVFPLALALPPAHAQLRQPQALTLEAANRLAQRAVEACRLRGRAIAVSVVDEGGNLVALQRGDGVGPHNTDASRRKAYTALSTRSPTLDLARKAQADPDARNLAGLQDLLLLGGGVPLLAKGVPLGAIGVAGAGGALNDHACAHAAAAAVSDLDQPVP